MRKNKTMPSIISNYTLLYEHVYSRYAYTSILESLGEYDSKTSRYTIIGILAEEVLYEKNDEYFLKNLALNDETQVNWLDILDEWVDLTTYNDGTPYQLGCIGYIGYENKYEFENMKKYLKKDTLVSKTFIVKYRITYVYDRATQKGIWLYYDDTDIKTIKQIEKSYQEKSHFEDFCVLGDIERDFTYDEYIKNIKQCISHINCGDIFQANITMRYHGMYKGEIYQLYKALRSESPNPYFALLDFDYPLISTSPESYIEINKNLIMGRPIKGTIRCLINDKDQGEKLIGSVKNCAENIMITDLIRNDIGRVSTIGSVKVLELCELKKFNNLYHLQSVVCGNLRNNLKISDVLRTNFPGGSITGAPKIKSMEIIEDLEFVERGPYTGAIGFWGCNGYVNTSIGIRIIYFDKDKFYYHVGGGIVSKSNAFDEYNEIILKAEKLHNTLNKFNILRTERNKIDKIDLKIIDLLTERFDLIKIIAKIKNDNKIPIIQNERIQNIIKDRVNYVKNTFQNLDEEFIKKIFYLIIENSMQFEESEEK